MWRLAGSNIISAGIIQVVKRRMHRLGQASTLLSGPCLIVLTGSVLFILKVCPATLLRASLHSLGWSVPKWARGSQIDAWP